MQRYLEITLLSDTTFASGESAAGEVDIEVIHDEFGMPEIPGKTLKGLLRDAWLTMSDSFPEDLSFAESVFGYAGDNEQRLQVSIQDARLPEKQRQWLQWACTRSMHPISPLLLRDAFTVVKTQTARDRLTGYAAPETLRSSRAVCRGIVFHAAIGCVDDAPDLWRILARSCLAVRHAGVQRHRGRGNIRIALMEAEADITEQTACLEVSDD